MSTADRWPEPHRRQGEWTGDEFRRLLKQVYWRPGWKARNLDAGNGRVYDLMDWYDKPCLVEIDAMDSIVTGYIGDESVYEAEIGIGRDESIKAVDRCFAAVEDELMRREAERQEA